MALTLRQAGEKLLHWHSGMDAVYAVGSYYVSGKEYPDPEVIEEARDQLARDLPKAEAGMHGWTRRDAAELRSLVRFLDGKLKKYKRNGSDDAFDDAFTEEEMREGYVILDAPGRGGGYIVSHQGRALFGGKRYRSLESAQNAISEHMHDHDFYPNVYYVNDHGNVDLLNEDGSVFASRV